MSFSLCISSSDLLISIKLLLNLSSDYRLTFSQRLMGASLLIFLNKTDVNGCMTESDIHEVRPFSLFIRQYSNQLWCIGSSIGCNQNAQMGDIPM
jgi:hypothetical protein